jgi:hypothetical protein
MQFEKLAACSHCLKALCRAGCTDVGKVGDPFRGGHPWQRELEGEGWVDFQAESSSRWRKK